jgi:hypothetical protein
LEQTSLADLTGGEIVNAVLESVDLFDASDFGLVEVFYIMLGMLGKTEMGRERTLGGIACLVILGEPTKINVLHPRNPLLVLVVIGSLSPLHCEEYIK